MSVSSGIKKKKMRKYTAVVSVGGLPSLTISLSE